ncbi:MAG: lytic murein transglycosylase [Hyphomicrobiaceae bacterium]|nr:lytic murein transglycosylase [Hyphomicrobiaceae bacterium]
MRSARVSLVAASAVLAALAASVPARAETPPPPPPAAANCQNTQSFERWLGEFRKEALASGISRQTVTRVLDDMTLDPSIIARDRKQGFFSQTFTAFSGKLISAGRIKNGQAKLKQHRELFERVEKEFGVPGAVITAFWGLESDFGGGMGDQSVLRSLATLAYDCRRGEMFRKELLDAMRIVEAGDLQPSEMIGAWAGELGQTQFLPSHYLKYAVDYDGDGKRNLLRSVPDVIASTASFIKSLGWRPGEPWMEEVRVPQSLAWDQADLAIQHPRSKWAEWGVKDIHGNPVKRDALPASLLLPMGRFGPAFLAYPNFQIYPKWNQSLNYCITAAHLATRLEGAPAFNKGSKPIEELSFQQAKELQQLLIKRGFLEGEADGKIGAGTRKAVKAAQLKLGLPADSYPTFELLEKLGGRARRERAEN